MEAWSWAQRGPGERERAGPVWSPEKEGNGHASTGRGPGSRPAHLVD